MRIGIDARFFNESGVGRYLRNLIRSLMVLDKDNQYFIFLLPKDFDKFVESKNFKKVLADFSWYGFAEQFKFPSLLNQYNLDLIHFPHFNVPIFYTGKFVVTIHDLIHQHRSMGKPTMLNPVSFKIKQLGYRKVFKTAVTKSQQIFVPSNCVKKLLMEEWHISDKEIIVTPEAVDEGIVSLADKMTGTKVDAILKKFKIDSPFIFYVGNAHPHKNVEGLIKAFSNLNKQRPNLKLVLSGYDHFFWQRIKKQFQHPSVIFTGFVSDEQLVALYKGAESFVIPSFEEGFGIPILEAMACGCPVVASNTASLPEVGKDAVLYFNPHSIDDMREKLTKLLNSQSLRLKLIKKGKERVKKFSWNKLAQQTLSGYKKSV
ncbi:glycosyltransferase family 4 protein [Candidatus Daviesbacteria bacterium]|nr:glycosyltransferase family 4 protein [Candidatus Daviesbacteria bacterium]